MVEAADKAQLKSSAPGSRVLVAVDFSKDSKAALVWAGEYAGQVGAKLVVLHVVHDPGEAPGSYKKSDQDLLRPMEDVAKKMLTDFLRDVKAENPQLAALGDAEAALVKGIPETRILEFARSCGARGIVIGSRGRTGLPHLLLGSKSERVAQLSPVPVTIVKADNHDD